MLMNKLICLSSNRATLILFKLSNLLFYCVRWSSGWRHCSRAANEWKAASQLRDALAEQRWENRAFNCWKRMEETKSKSFQFEWIQRFKMWNGKWKVMANWFSILFFSLPEPFDPPQNPRNQFLFCFFCRMSNYVECNLNDSRRENEKGYDISDRLIKFSASRDEGDVEK